MTHPMLALNLPGVMQALYLHEINCGMQSFWDGGWRVWIGDELNGVRIENVFEADEFPDIPEWLLKQAKDFYPNAVSLH